MTSDEMLAFFRDLNDVDKVAQGDRESLWK